MWRNHSNLAIDSRIGISYAVGSAAYATCLRLSHELLYILRLSSSPNFLSHPVKYCFSGIISPALIASSGIIAAKLSSQINDIHVSPMNTSILTLLTFRVQRGLSVGFFNYSFRCIAPSHLAEVGSFGSRNASRPADLDKYIHGKSKQQNSEFGKKFGCHSCGDRKAEKFIGDHIPPNKWKKVRRFRFWFTEQRFYPQCPSCSSAQGSAVAIGRGYLRRHKLTSLRFWHLWIPLHFLLDPTMINNVDLD